MNQQIRQLAEQAGVDYDLRPEIARAPVWIGTDEELEKFAELIVRECAKQAYREELTVEEGMMRYRHILEHFGVEE